MADSYSTTVTRDEIRYELDVNKLAEPVAQVIRDEIRAGIRAIAVMSHDGKHRLFNKTGHLVDGLSIEQTGDGSWSVVAPSDRLGTPELMARLVELVPIIANPLSSPKVQAAIEESWSRLVGAR